MLKNYLRIALRNIARHKAYSFINIAGLSIGMACSILILLWVQHENSYDRFHKNAANIYRITAIASEFAAAVNPAPMPLALKEEFPEVTNYVRFSNPVSAMFEAGEKKFVEKNGFYADSTILEVFSFKLRQGNAATALKRPDAILLTHSMAKKYFGNENPLNKTLKKDNKDLLVVTGILEDIPANSHLQFDYVMPIAAIAQTNNDIKNNVWDNFNFYNYLLFDKNFKSDPSSLAKFEQRIDAFYKTKESNLKVNFHLQPLTRIHLHSNLQADLPGHGNVQYVTIFTIVAIFILMVACINFMNLATARSARRAREVGIRKVAGALRQQLIYQFLGEAVIISLFALLIAIGIVFLVLPLFNSVSQKSLGLNLLNGNLWLGLLAIAFTTGILSGSYPALFLSNFRPVKVLKGGLRKAGGSLLFRNGLVVVQFVVSIVLLVGTITVYNQLNFIRNRNIGYDKENLLYMNMTGELWQKQDLLKSMLAQNPSTSQFTLVNDLPVNMSSGTISVEWDGKDPNTQPIFPTLGTSENFVNVFKVKLLDGRGFSNEFKGDTSNYVINEKAARAMGMTAANAVGKNLTLWGNKGIIIGVVKDFNYKPAHQPIEPLIMFLNKWGGTVVVRSQPGSLNATVNNLAKISRQLNPAYPFSYNFVDQDIARLYESEKRLGKLFNIFAILAVIISCMGLYGLSAFMAEQRVREIGVRKVLGASMFNIVYLLSYGFTKLIMVAILIAIPLSWYMVSKWLNGFAYHIEIGWVIFLIASVAALIIAWCTVSYESIRAALANPVTSLRTE